MDKPSYLELAVEAASLRVRLQRVQCAARKAALDVSAEAQELRAQLDTISDRLCRSRDRLARELFARLQVLEARVA